MRNGCQWDGTPLLFTRHQGGSPLDDIRGPPNLIQHHNGPCRQWQISLRIQCDRTGRGNGSLTTATPSIRRDRISERYTFGFTRLGSTLQ
ncbi:MAG: hypothetical protein ACK517_00335, partial [bacterium]